MLALCQLSLHFKSEMTMALSREYRIRELYLKHFDENISRETKVEFLTLLEEMDGKVIRHLSKIRGDSGDPSVWDMVDTYAYALFDTYANSRHHISPMKELNRWRRHRMLEPDGDQLAKLDRVLSALAECKLAVILSDEGLNALASTLRLFIEFLQSTSDFTLQRFAISLREYVLYTVCPVLEEAVFEEKVRLYGRLLQIHPHDGATSAEAIRVALQCMPAGDAKSSNVFLFVMVKCWKIWPQVRMESLHTPVDVDVNRVIGRIGITPRHLSNFDYEGIGYAVIQALSRRLVPENPSALYSLKYVGSVWCKSRSANCAECQLNDVCAYAQAAA